MKRHWKKIDGNRTDTIDLVDGIVVVGTDEGFGHGCSAGHASCAEFVAGKLNEQVAQMFGDQVLGEVRTAAAGAA